MKSKQEIRTSLLKKLATIPKASRQAAAKRLMTRLQSHISYQKAQSVAIYLPLASELDLTRLLADASKQFLIPKTFEKGEMIFTRYQADQLIRTPFGTLEVAEGLAEIPDLIVVPAVGWRVDGYRLGYGAGFYDRYLANYKGMTIGLALQAQCMAFDTEPHDLPVKEILIDDSL